MAPNPIDLTARRRRRIEGDLATMIRVLIVDDEEMTRSGLREFVPWEKHGFEVVGEAEDGLQALEQYTRLQPRLVLCDVRMPRMDGLAFTRKIREMDSDCKIIFLSGYTDIQYLQSAIRVHAVDYLLKPVQIDELEALLVRVVEEIRQSEQAKGELEQIKEQLHRSKPELADRLLKKLLQPANSERDWEETMTEMRLVNPSFPTSGAYRCCVFAHESDETVAEWAHYAQQEAREAEVQVWISTLDKGAVACVPLDGGRTAESFTMWLHRLTGKGKQPAADRIAVGISEPVTTLESIHVAYRQAVKALRYQFYRGWGTLIWYRELPVDHPSGLFDKQVFLRFEELLKQKQLGEAIEWVDQTVNELILYPHSEVNAVRRKLFRWYVAITKVYPEAMWEFENDELWSSVFVSGELFRVHHFLTQRLAEIREAMEQEDVGEKSVIRDVIQFIHLNYSKDVSIPTVAQHVFLTPTYLCILFKKEKGISINDYITQYRIDQAIKLLADRKLKLYEISERVGYQDANYFAKVFRKRTGVKPSEYREKLT